MAFGVNVGWWNCGSFGSSIKLGRRAKLETDIKINDNNEKSGDAETAE